MGPIGRGTDAQPQHNHQAPHCEKENGEQARKRRDDKPQRCLFHKSTTPSDADCQTQHHNKTDGESANCATHSGYHAVLGARDHPPGCNTERPCISFTMVKVPTEEEGFWPFGPTNEPVASFRHSASGDVPTDNSRLFGAFGGVPGEETGNPAFMTEEGLVRELSFETASSAIWRP